MWDAGQLSYWDPPDGSGLSVMALTGPCPTIEDKSTWAELVGPNLADFTMEWEKWRPAVGLADMDVADEDVSEDGEEDTVEGEEGVEDGYVEGDEGTDVPRRVVGLKGGRRGGMEERWPLKGARKGSGPLFKAR
jgi:hypothetical protein